MAKFPSETSIWLYCIMCNWSPFYTVKLVDFGYRYMWWFADIDFLLRLSPRSPLQEGEIDFVKNTYIFSFCQLVNKKHVKLFVFFFFFYLWGNNMLNCWHVSVWLPLFELFASLSPYFENVSTFHFVTEALKFFFFLLYFNLISNSKKYIHLYNDTSIRGWFYKNI